MTLYWISGCKMDGDCLLVTSCQAKISLSSLNCRHIK